MIPVKLVETIFHRYWALLVPVILVPLVAMALRPVPKDFQSTAVVWVSAPVEDSQQAIGLYNTYLSPAQNQELTLRDLLATETFRAAVVVRAGLVEEDASEGDIRWAANHVNAFAYASGINLLSISAVSHSSADSKAIVQATIDEYLVRATTEIQQDAEVAEQYYAHQLSVAQQALTEKSAELAAYLVEHPRASDPTHAASREVAYITLVDQTQARADIVNSLQDSLQSVRLRAASAPETQEAQFSVQDAPTEAAAPLPVSLTTRVGVPMAGMVLGLLIGATYLYVAYRTDHTIRSGEDLATVDVPLLGSVPQLQAAPKFVRYTPVGWFIAWRRRDFARKTAAAIARAPQTTPKATGGTA